MPQKTPRKTARRRTVFVAGYRIPFQRAGSGYAELTSYDLGRLAIKGLLDKTEIDRRKIDRVIFGTVIANMTTSNVARECSLAAGIPHSVAAFTVTMACISANLAITTGVELINSGQADIVIAGGTESLSDIPIRYQKQVRKKLIEAQKLKKPVDYLKLLRGFRPKDLLPEIPQIAEYSTGRTMGEDCDRLAARLGVTRQAQDAYALRSHQAAAKAAEAGLLAAEMLPVRIPPDFVALDCDNGIRGDSTMEKLQNLQPAFIKPHGTLTAGNSSFLTDGAAAALLMNESMAKALGFKPRAAFRSYAYSAQDPYEELLLGPAYASPAALDLARVGLKDIDVFEFHEAFAAQVLANLDCLASKTFAREKLGRRQAVGEIPMEKLNTWGGSLSIGHPFGATGARLLTTAVHRLEVEDGTLALIASCAAGAHGNAIVLERLN